MQWITTQCRRVAASRWLRLAGALLLQAACCQAQTKAAATFQRDIVRVQAELVRAELLYQARYSRAKSVAKVEGYRRELVAAADKADQKLRALPELPARVPLRALALRVARAQRQLFDTSYKRVIDLNAYQNNSLVALRAYFDAFDAALGQTVVLNDSLRAARRDFADENYLASDNDELRMLDHLLSAQHRLADLLHYQHQIILPVTRVGQSLTALIQSVGVADVAAFDKARRQLAGEVATSTADLAKVSDFANLDVLYRNAARALMATYAGICDLELARMSALLHASPTPSPADMAAINQYLADFTAKVNAANEAYGEASTAFFKTYRPVLDNDNRHSDN